MYVKPVMANPCYYKINSFFSSQTDTKDTDESYCKERARHLISLFVFSDIINRQMCLFIFGPLGTKAHMTPEMQRLDVISSFIDRSAGIMVFSTQATERLILL